MKLIDDFSDYPMACLSKVSDMIKKLLAESHTVLKVLIGRDQVTPVVLKLHVPPFLLLLLLLLMKVVGPLEVTVYLTIKFPDSILSVLVTLIVGISIIILIKATTTEAVLVV
jgi:hypothetical protein